MTGPGAALVDQSTGVPTLSEARTCSICGRSGPPYEFIGEECFACLREEEERNRRLELDRLLEPLP